MPALCKLGMLIVLLALATIGQAFAATREPSSHTLCEAIGSGISISPDAPPEPATQSPAGHARVDAVKPAAVAPARAVAVEPASAATAAAGSSVSRGGGDATVEPRGRWKSFLPGTFK